MKADIKGIKTDDNRIRPRKSELERLWADNNKAAQLTSWRPGNMPVWRGSSEGCRQPSNGLAIPTI